MQELVFLIILSIGHTVLEQIPRLFSGGEFIHIGY